MLRNRYKIKSDFHTMDSNFLLNGLSSYKRIKAECLDHSHNPNYEKDLFEINLILNDLKFSLERGMSYSRFTSLVEKFFLKNYSKDCKIALDKYEFNKQGVCFDFLLFDGNVYQLTFLFDWGNDSITIYPKG